MVWTITLAFNSAEIIEASINRYYEAQCPDLPFRHVLVDNEYPLRTDAVKDTLARLAARYGCLILSPGVNRGLHGSWNWAMAQLPIKPDDVLIGYDPDSYPISPGFDMALVRAVLGDERHMWSSLMSPRAMPEIQERGYTERVVDSHIRTWALRRPVVNSICAWRASFLQESGGLHEASQYYGHLECSMWDRLKVRPRDWVFLPDWYEDDRLRGLSDREYTVWKWRHAHLRDWPGDFASFVTAGCPGVAPQKLP